MHTDNDVFPNINRINEGNAPLFMAYIGDYNSLNINPDSIKGEETITIYYLEDIGCSNAFFDRMAIRKLLKKVDPELKFNSAVPVRIEFKNNQAKYMEESFSDL